MINGRAYAEATTSRRFPWQNSPPRPTTLMKHGTEFCFQLVKAVSRFCRGLSGRFEWSNNSCTHAASSMVVSSQEVTRSRPKRMRLLRATINMTQVCAGNIESHTPTHDVAVTLQENRARFTRIESIMSTSQSCLTRYPWNLSLTQHGEKLVAPAPPFDGAALTHW